MLGGLYLLLNTIGLTTGYVKDNISNTNIKEYAEQLYKEGKNPAHIYIDTQGNTRDLFTNRKVVTYRDKNRDLIVKDLKTGVETNIDKPIREAEYEKEEEKSRRKAIENDGVAPFGTFEGKAYSKSFLLNHDRYIDKYRNLYIKKYIVWNSKTMRLNKWDRIGVFYMNIKTNKIDYVEVVKAGEIFRTFGVPSYSGYHVLYANEEESEKYKEYYNQYICENEEEPLKYWGKFWEYDYKRGR